MKNTIKEIFENCLMSLNEAERKELVVLLIASTLNPKPTKDLGVDLIRYAERCNKEWIEVKIRYDKEGRWVSDED